MSNGDQSLAERLREKTDKKPTTFLAILEPYKAEIARALPRHLNADRICRIALTAFRRNAKLAECDPRSVFAAVIQAAQLGLEIDTLGQAYLIPYEKRKVIDGQWRTVGYECQFVPGWLGLVELVNRSGRATVYSGVIMKDQKYRFQDGSDRRLDVLNETALDEPTDITHAYAVGRVKGGVVPIIELWRTEKIAKHRDRYNKVGQRHYSYDNWEMYCRKVVLLQLIKYVPKSAELTTAMELSRAAESPEGQGLTIEGTLDGSWAPPPAEEERGTELGNGSPPPANRSQSTTGTDAGPRRSGGLRNRSAGPQSSPEWPQFSDGKWYDYLGHPYDPNEHAWSEAENRPVVTNKGVFQKQSPSSTPEWPQMGADGLWRDSARNTFREDQHGWNATEKRPSVTEAGVFRTRRGTGQAEAAARGGVANAGSATPAAPERAASAQQQRDRGEREEEGW